MKKKHALENPPEVPQHNTINPVPVFNSKERDEENKKIQDYAHYFNQRPDGSWYVNKDGRKALELKEVNEYESMTPGDYITGISGKKKYIAKDIGFYNFVKKLNGGKDPMVYDTKTKQTRYAGTLGPGQLGNMYGQHIKKNLPTSYDAHQSTALPIPIHQSQQEGFTQSFVTGLPKDGNKSYMEIVDYDSSKGKYVPTGEKLTDLKGLNVTHIVPVTTKSGEDIIYYVQDADRNTYKVKSYINPTEHKSILGRTKDFKNYAYVLNKRKKPVFYAGSPVIDKDTGLPVLSNEDLDINTYNVLKDDFLKANDDIKTHASQMVVPIKTGSEDYSPLSPVW